MEEKDITMSEFCSLWKVDPHTRKKMARIALHRARQLGTPLPSRTSAFSPSYWRCLLTAAENMDRCSIGYETVSNFMRKTKRFTSLTPAAFLEYMQAHYKGYPSHRKTRNATESVVFLYSDLRDALHTIERQARQQMLDNPLQPVEAVKPRPTPVCSAAEGQGLLGFVLGALSGAAVAVLCVLCCF